MEVTLVEINVKDDKIDEFLRVFEANHLGAIKEPGNLRFDVLQDSAVPSRFYIYEAYTDDAAVQAHKKTPHYLACVEALEALMTEPRKKTVFKGVFPS
ncbi:(4S)-4-hydroxy-5-phosphonooxypentane-2,3-dione isomerase [Enterobacterales bacterium CwR94]|nr:(4S)-4-hydroxy-5-phosphonooxypentane-2,3-dione isomerase [Enterobacterales bacterium CwR94]